VRDAAGVNRKVSLTEATTREQAKRLEADLRMQARRQREGLEPLATDRRWTVRELLRWWLDEYVKGGPSERQEEGRFRLYFDGEDLAQLPVVALTSAQLEVFLQRWAKEGLAPASVNKLRAMVRTAWNRARKAGKLHGPNPAADVEPRKVPKRAPAFLEADEVPRLLAQLSPRDRLIAAVAVYAGLRKGELFGLRKPDVDLARRILTVRRSYDHETTKGGREEPVPIATALVPYLEDALASASGELLFPRADGSMRTDGDALGERMRRALGRAAVVTGYLHSCRRCKRAGEPQEAEHPDNERRRCPKCSMVLWAKPIPKKLRLHDTRHTTATLLLAGGADLYAVARILRHTDPKVTFETYAHLVPGYLHDQVDRLSAMVPGVLSPDGQNRVGDRSSFVPQPAGTEVAESAEESSSVPSVHCPVHAKLEGSSLSSISTGIDATPVPRQLQKAASDHAAHRETVPASAHLEGRAWRESNPRPAASKAAALSS
jgi:integrase